MKRDLIIWLLIAVLLGMLVMFALWGCGCFGMKTKEGFEDAAEEAQDTEVVAPVSDLTPQEEELFKDIQSGSLDDSAIQKMIESGKITEQMVEKFLAYLDTQAPEAEVSTAAAAPASKKPAMPKQEEEGFDIEPFVGTVFASAK